MQEKNHPLLIHPSVLEEQIQKNSPEAVEQVLQKARLSRMVVLHLRPDASFTKTWGPKVKEIGGYYSSVRGYAARRIVKIPASTPVKWIADLLVAYGRQRNAIYLEGGRAYGRQRNAIYLEGGRHATPLRYAWCLDIPREAYDQGFDQPNFDRVLLWLLLIFDEWSQKEDEAAQKYREGAAKALAEARAEYPVCLKAWRAHLAEKLSEVEAKLVQLGEVPKGAELV